MTYDLQSAAEELAAHVDENTAACAHEQEQIDHNFRNVITVSVFRVCNKRHSVKRDFGRYFAPIFEIFEIFV